MKKIKNIFNPWGLKINYFKMKFNVFLNRKNMAMVLIIVFVFSFLFPMPLVSPREALALDSQNILSQELNKVISYGPVALANALTDPELQAKSVLVYDQNSKLVLYSKEIDKKLEIASLTKLMTALVAVAQPNFNQPIIITKADKVYTSPILNLKVGDKVLPEDLVKAMLVGSANDAALTLANHLTNFKNFIAAMNAEAQILGLSNTRFSTPIGFDDPQNFSTASDLQKLVDYAVQVLPYREIWQNLNYGFSSLNGTQYKIANSNTLISDHPNIKSIKTGQTTLAQGNMVVSAQNLEGHRIIVIVLGSNQRERDTLAAVDFAFKNFVWHEQ